jgi:hypothetical protein
MPFLATRLGSRGRIPGARGPARQSPGRTPTDDIVVPTVPARPAHARAPVGPSQARPASSIASAVSRRPTSPATSATTPTNHHLMQCSVRAAKVAGIADRLPAPRRLRVPSQGVLADPRLGVRRTVRSASAVERLHADGRSVAHCPHPPTSIRPEEHRLRSSSVLAASSIPEVNWVQLLDARSAPVPHRRCRLRRVAGARPFRDRRDQSREAERILAETGPYQ